MRLIMSSDPTSEEAMTTTTPTVIRPATLGRRPVIVAAIAGVAALAGFGIGSVVADDAGRTAAPAAVESNLETPARSWAAQSARLEGLGEMYQHSEHLPRSADGASRWLQAEADAATGSLPRSADAASRWLAPNE
jgi:hypothetical protein